MANSVVVNEFIESWPNQRRGKAMEIGKELGKQIEIGDIHHLGASKIELDAIASAEDHGFAAKLGRQLSQRLR
jgi:hypothetical protein